MCQIYDHHAPKLCFHGAVGFHLLRSASCALILQANEPLGVYILVSATRQIAGHIYIVKRENERGRQRETPQYVVGDRNSLFNVFHHLVPLFLLTFPLSIFMVDRGGKPKWFNILSYG